jgi:hypothetical protein
MLPLLLGWTSSRFSRGDTGSRSNSNCGDTTSIVCVDGETKPSRQASNEIATCA